MPNSDPAPSPSPAKPGTSKADHARRKAIMSLIDEIRTPVKAFDRPQIRHQQQVFRRLRAYQRGGRTLGADVLDALIGFVESAEASSSMRNNVRHIAALIGHDSGMTDELVARMYEALEPFRYDQGCFMRYPCVPVSLVYEALCRYRSMAFVTSATKHPIAVRDPRVRARLLEYHSSSSIVLRALVATAATPEEAAILLSRLQAASSRQAVRSFVKGEVPEGTLVPEGVVRGLLEHDDSRVREKVIVALPSLKVGPTPKDTLPEFRGSHARRKR